MSDKQYNNNSSTKKFCCRYEHNGATWGLDIDAFDFEDAQERADGLNLMLDGDLKFTIEADPKNAKEIQALADSICAIQNVIQECQDEK